MTVKYIHAFSDIPKQEHYAIIQFGSIYIPGDERSRTNPGHGYPASYETTIEMITFTDVDDLTRWIAQNESKKNWVAVSVTPLNVTKEIKIDVKPVGT